MNHYKQLAIRYLKMNRRRSITTILGVTIAAAFLYLILNMGWSGLLNERKEQREKQDYEIVLMTETASQIEQIMKDKNVKSALAGEYYYYDYYNPKTYKNALYINTVNPYRMNSVLEYLEDTYEVKGDYNEDLAWTYLQGDDGNAGIFIILATLMVSFIFVIFGVGIVRNSIQLSTLEQIKDYGNLRCIGASKSQLKKVIYMEGAVLEIIGMIIGIFLGTLFSLVAGHILQWKAGFHFIPLVPIAITFLGDLFFAMDENCKVIVNMTPVSAIRGEFRIKKEKIKVRKKSIFGKLFGVEGDYAYKNIMRNPGRFHKTVWALGIGAALFMTVAGVLGSVLQSEKKTLEQFKYYQVYFSNAMDASETMDSIQGTLPPYDILKRVSKLEGVTDVKQDYSARIYTYSIENMYSHYNEKYLTETWAGEGIQNSYTRYSNEKETTGELNYFWGIECAGYDKDDYGRLKSTLTAGTLNVSENGIVLVNTGELEKKDSESLVPEMHTYTFTDYKVGDTIDIIDMKKLRSLMSVELENLSKEYEEKKKEKEKLIQEGKIEDPDSELDNLYNEYYFRKPYEKQADCIKKLKKEKCYKTYTIEGIVKEDVNMGNIFHGMKFILPLGKYFKLTATDETMSTGMRYHFDKFSYKKYEQAVGLEYVGFDEGTRCTFSIYPILIYAFSTAKGIIIGVIIFAMFIILMVALNVLNTTASNFHLRRKEFAQLRVIGTSKSGLIKMIMFEGIIEAIVASLIGIIFGTVLSGFLLWGLKMLYGISYYFPIISAICMLVIIVLILCGSSYMHVRKMNFNMAGDLATGGD